MHLPHKFFFIFIFTLVYIANTGCRKKIEQENFSTGLANRDERIREGIEYISSGKIREAKKFFRELGEKDNTHCGYLIGLPLVQIQDYLAKISTIINVGMNIWSSMGQQSGTTAPKVIRTTARDFCDQSVDSIIRDFVSSLHQDTSGGLELIDRAIEQKCEMELEYPLMLSVGPNFKLHLIMYGRFGNTELSFLRYFGYFVLLISDIILAHDFSVNTLEILSNVTKINTSDIIGLLRSLAFLVQGCSKTFMFHPEDQKFMMRVPGDLLNSIDSGLDFLEALEKSEGREEYVITFYDRSGDGRLGHDENKTTVDTPEDEITLKIRGEFSAGGARGTLKALKIKIPYIITTQFIEEFKNIVRKIADIVREGKTGCPENCLSISDINFFLRALDVGEIDDFARLDIVKFFYSPRSLRELLPYWFLNNDEGRWEFMIEAEVPPSGGDTKYYLFKYDAQHFTKPATIEFYGRTISGYSIPPDCVFIENSPVNWIVIPYLNFQDPTFGEAIYIRLKNTLIVRCNPAEEYIFESDEWNVSTLYMTNKAIAVIVEKGGSVISPLTELIIKSVEVINE